MQKIDKILVIQSGGTICMMADDDGVLSTKKTSNIFTYIEKTADEYIVNSSNYTSTIAKEFSNKNIDNKNKNIFLELVNENIIKIDQKNIKLTDSADMSSTIYRDIATIIYNEYHKYDGFVLLCGTDTISYTSSALSFMLSNLNKPIVLTGSMVPIYKDESDGKTNLLNAINIAAANASLLPKIPEVIVVFGSKIIRGTRACKIDSTSKNPFLSPNYPLLGKIDKSGKIEIDRDNILKILDNDTNIVLNSAIFSRVAILYFHPMLNTEQIKSIILDKKIDGIVLVSYGSGNIKIDKKIIKIIKKAINKKNKVVLNISQCLIGGTDMELYKNSKTLLDIGVIDGLDMTIECAIVKLSFVLANYGNDYGYYLTKSMVGEIKRSAKSTYE